MINVRNTTQAHRLVAIERVYLRIKCMQPSGYVTTLYRNMFLKFIASYVNESGFTFLFYSKMYFKLKSQQTASFHVSSKLSIIHAPSVTLQGAVLKIRKNKLAGHRV